MAPADPNLKQLRIKCGTVKRTMKEYQSYRKEEVDQKAKIDKMKAEGADEHDVKQQLEVLNDTLTVLPDTLSRLQKYHEELSAFLEETFVDIVYAEKEEERTDTEKQVLEARQLLKDAGEFIPSCLMSDGQ